MVECAVICKSIKALIFKHSYNRLFNHSGMSHSGMSHSVAEQHDYENLKQTTDNSARNFH